MTRSHIEQWKDHEQQFIQKSFIEHREFISKEYSYDISRIITKIHCSETKIPEGYDSIPNHTVHFMEGDKTIMALEFTRISRDFEDFLWHPDKTEYMPYGIVKQLSRIDIAEALSEQTLKALTHIISLVITYGLVMCEEAEMRRQPKAFQEIWKMMWGEGKQVAYQGVHFLRYDDPIGWNAF